MATILGSKYGNQTLASVNTITVTISVASFVQTDFAVARLVGLWNSAGTIFKGMAWVRRFISTSQLELQTLFFDPATGLDIIQTVGDIILISKNFSESVGIGIAISNKTVTFSETIIFGGVNQNSLCFYDENKEINTNSALQIQGGLTVLGKLDGYLNNSVSSACNIFFTVGGTILSTQNANSNFAMYGGVLTGTVSPSYIGGYQGTSGNTMVFNGVENPFDFISPGAGASWGAKASRQQLVNCYSVTTAFNAIMRRWGDGKIVGGRYKFPNFTSAPISAFGSDAQGTYTVTTPSGDRAVVLDAGNGVALVRSSGGTVNFNFTNLITTDFRNVTGTSGSLSPNTSSTNTFSFSETYTGLQLDSVGVILDSVNKVVQSVLSSLTSWSPVLLRRTCVGDTVTVNSTYWAYAFKKYGREVVNAVITPSTYNLGTAGQADNVVFGGLISQSLDTGVTLSNASALSLSSKFTALNIGNGSITITANASLDELYDYLIAWGSSSVALAQFPSIASYPINFAGSELLTAMSVVVNSGAVLSTGTKFKSITSGGITITGNALSNITINGNVTQNTPTNLSNVTITGILTYNTPTTTSVTFTTSTLATVNNTGAGIVTIKRINSTLTLGTNVTAYTPTTLNLTLNGGRIRILDNLGVEQFNQTSDGVIELPSNAIGTWTYRIAKYGSQLIESTFTIDGRTKNIIASYIPDTFVVDTLINVQAYTELNSTQKIYDYQSYNLTTATGIVIGSKLSKSFGTINVTGDLVLNNVTTNLFDYNSNVLTVKTSNLSEITTIFSTGNFIQNTTTISNDLKIRALNLNSEIVYNSDSLTFYPTVVDRDSGTNAGLTTTGGVYRYKFGTVYSGVTMTNPLNIRYVVAGTVSLGTLAITTGNFAFNLTTIDLLLQSNNFLRIVNANVMDGSILVPADRTF